MLATLYEIVGRANKAKMNRKIPRDEGATIAEAIPALGWVQISPAPAPYLQDGPIEGHEFWANKVRKANKDREGGANHIKWCNEIKALLVNLKVYVKEYHLTGLTWNPRGGDATDFGGAAPPAIAPKAEAKQAPDPPAAAAAPPPAPVADKGSLFAQIGAIDQSGGRTAGLRKVTKDMKSKGASGVVAAAPKRAAPKAAAAPTKPAKCVLRGNKWDIEYQTGMCTLEADQVTTRQTAYIYGCVGATIIINGKMNSITVDSCKKTNIIFDNVVSSCEMVNCKGMKVQVRGLCPSIAIDKTDGILVYLSAEAVPQTVIVSSKSSEMNVSFPVEGSEDYVEKPIPEQFQHRVVGQIVSSDVSDLYTH